MIYEQCVRTFWNMDRYKDDHRYLKVWLAYVSSLIIVVLRFNTFHICTYYLFLGFNVHLDVCFSIRSSAQFVLQAENCADAEVIYSFLRANGIGQAHSSFYISYALHMESKNKLKNANEIFNIGLDR